MVSRRDDEGWEERGDMGRAWGTVEDARDRVLRAVEALRAVVAFDLDDPPLPGSLVLAHAVVGRELATLVDRVGLYLSRGEGEGETEEGDAGGD